MSEVPTSFGSETIDLHAVAGLREVHVRDGVLLRPMEVHDADTILEILAADPSIRERVGIAAKMLTVDDVHRKVVEYQQDSETMRYVIVRDGEVAGLIGFWKDGDFFPGRKGQPHSYGFGYFSSPKHRGEHLVTDSLRALMAIAQSSFRVDSFIAFCESDNRPSIAVLESVGLVNTGSSYVWESTGWREYMYEKKVSREQAATA